MALVEFARSILGILFVMRTMLVFRERNLSRAPVVEATGLVSLISISLIGFAAPATPLLRLLSTFALAALPSVVARIDERRRLAALGARVPLFLDRWILDMRLGGAAVAARATALREEGADLQALLRPVFESTPKIGRKHPILRPAVLRELEQVSSASHGALARLEMLRTHLREDSEFRRKSGQAVRQSAIQAATMLFMLVALTVYTIHRYGWAQSGDLVTIAIAWSLVGTALMVRLSRKAEWKL